MAAIYMCPQCGKQVIKDARGRHGPALRIRSYCQATGRNAVLRLHIVRPRVGQVCAVEDGPIVWPHTEAR